MRGFLIVDHGSRRSEANAQLEEVARRFAQRVTSQNDVLVACCHMEVVPPTIADGFATLVAQGATSIRVLPYFLSDGRHSREDIPQLCADAARAYPNVPWSLAPVLGPDELLISILVNRTQIDR